MSKKPRGDSRLKTLPEARQETIAEYARSRTLDETVAWLRADGLQTSRAALSAFLSWRALGVQLRENESTVETLLGELQKSDRTLTAERVQEIGQAFFSALALNQQDAKLWKVTQQIELRKAGLKLERERFQRETCGLFLKWAEDKRAREIAAGSGSNSEKIEKLGALMFGENWR